MGDVRNHNDPIRLVLNDYLRICSGSQVRQTRRKKAPDRRQRDHGVARIGLCNTSLRDIAAKSDMSLGMLHYYFKDRSDLIIYCVRIYKQDFVAGMIASTRPRDGARRRD
jgi:AcrR family transcriptional regulator